MNVRSTRYGKWWWGVGTNADTRGVGRAAKRRCSLPLADARGLPDAMEHCSKRDVTRRTARHGAALRSVAPRREVADARYRPFSIEVWSSELVDGPSQSTRTRERLVRTERILREKTHSLRSVCTFVSRTSLNSGLTRCWIARVPREASFVKIRSVGSDLHG